MIPVQLLVRLTMAYGNCLLMSLECRTGRPASALPRFCWGIAKRASFQGVLEVSGVLSGAPEDVIVAIVVFVSILGYRARTPWGFFVWVPCVVTSTVNTPKAPVVSGLHRPEKGVM